MPVLTSVILGMCAWRCAVETGRSPYIGNGTSTSASSHVPAQSIDGSGDAAAKQRAAELAAALYDEANDQCVACR